METLLQAIDLRQQDIAGLAEGVQMWIRFMRNLFFSGILFAYWRVEARLVLGIALLTALLLIGGKIVAPDVHTGSVGTVVHVTFWLPLFIYLVRNWKRSISYFEEKRFFSALYGVWLMTVIATLAISLVFDVKELVLLVGGS